MCIRTCIPDLFSPSSPPPISTAPEAMDVFVLVDAIAKCMCLEDRECCKVGEMALGLILDTASVLVGDKEKVSTYIHTYICTYVHDTCEGRCTFVRVVCVCVDYGSHKVGLMVYSAYSWER